MNSTFKELMSNSK